MRRHWPRRAAALICLAGVGAFALWPVTDPVTAASYERVVAGMTRADVEAMFGPPLTVVPPQDLNPDEYDFSERRREVLEPELCGREEAESQIWWGGTGELEVQFARGRVMTKAWYPRSKSAARLQRRWERWWTQVRRSPEL